MSVIERVKRNGGVLLVVMLAALLRLALLDMKPPHFDEGVNGWFVDQMTRNGFYHYDPENYHGPLHFYLLFLFQTLFGRHAWALRLPVAFISIACVWFTTRFDRFVDRRTCLFAALAMAVSPAAVFYGRYAIHESEFLFFLLLAVWGFVGLRRLGQKRYLWAAGLGLTGLVLTKETYVIHLACFGLAAFCQALWERLFPSTQAAVAERRWTARDVCMLGATCLGAIVFFYSGNLLDFSSLTGVPNENLARTPLKVLVMSNPLLHTFVAWTQTGTQGHGHEKAAWYWLDLIRRYEWPAVLGVIYSVRYLWPGSDRLMRYMAIYGCGTLVAYSVVPYKTPWCVISLLWPFFFLFGDLVRESASRWKAWAVYLPAGVLLAISLGLSVRLNYFHYTDEDEPYVYVQTFNDVHKLIDPLYKLAQSNPETYQFTGHILLPSYHPLPWLLGDFTKVGYYGSDSTPAEMDADFLLVDDSRVSVVEKGLKDAYFKDSLRLRGSQDPSTLYLSYAKFRALFPGREAEFQPESVR